MNSDHLIELAEQILQIGASKRRQATINRAISTAYYALFHALAAECVARTVGVPRSPRYWQTVTPIHRALDHGSTRKVFERLVRDSTTPDLLKQVGDTFLDLQSARHSADSDPSSRYSRQKAADLIAEARQAMDALRALPREDRLILAVQLITRPR